MGGKCEDNPLWNSGPLPLWFIFGKGFSLNSHLVQNTEFIPSRTQLRGDGKSYFSTSSPFPSPLRRSITAYSSSLRTVKAFKGNFLIFLDFGGFPSGVVFDPFIPWWLGHLTWLSLLTAFENDFTLQPPPSGCLYDITFGTQLPIFASNACLLSSLYYY